MPKNRKRVIQKGAKSVSVRTKYKIGGRKSNTGGKNLCREALQEYRDKGRKRDKNKIEKILRGRNV